MLSNRTFSYAIYFFCVFQAVFSSTLPWAMLNVERVGNTRTVYIRESQATADTADALIQLVNAESLAERYKNTVGRNEIEFLFVNVGYFAAGASAPTPAPAVTGKKGKKSSSTASLPTLSAFDTLSSDQVHNQIQTLYEDYTAAHFVKNLPGFIQLFCQRLYGQTLEGYKLDSQYFDQIKAFKLSFSAGKVVVYSYLILNEADDPDYVNRMHFGSQLSSLFPSSVPALLEQSAAGWQVIIETLKSSAGGANVSSLLSGPSTSTNSNKKGKKSKATTATPAPTPVDQVSNEEQAAKLVADLEREEQRKKVEREKKLKKQEEQRLKQEEENKRVRSERDAERQRKAEDDERKRKEQSDRDKMTRKQKLDEEKRKKDEDAAAKKQAAKQERLERERAEQERLEKERIAEEQRLEMERIAEEQRLEEERVEQQRLENERLEKRRLERERLEKERLEKERIAEQKRIEKERAAELARKNQQEEQKRLAVKKQQQEAEKARLAAAEALKKQKEQEAAEALKKQQEEAAAAAAAVAAAEALKKQKEQEEAFEQERLRQLQIQEAEAQKARQAQLEQEQRDREQREAADLAARLKEMELQNKILNERLAEALRLAQNPSSNHSSPVHSISSVSSFEASPLNYKNSPGFNAGVSQNFAAPQSQMYPQNYGTHRQQGYPAPPPPPQTHNFGAPPGFDHFPIKENPALYDHSVYSGHLASAKPSQQQYFPGNYHMERQYVQQQAQAYAAQQQQYAQQQAQPYADQQQQYAQYQTYDLHQQQYHQRYPQQQFPHPLPQQQRQPRYGFPGSIAAPLTVNTDNLPYGSPVIAPPPSTNSQRSRVSSQARSLSFSEDILGSQFNSPALDLAGIFGPSSSSNLNLSPLSELYSTSDVFGFESSAPNNGPSLYGAIGSGRSIGESKSESDDSHEAEHFLGDLGRDINKF